MPSNQPSNPDYVPSQFITHQPVTASKSEKDVDRFDRVQNREEAKIYGKKEVRYFIL